MMGVVEEIIAEARRRDIAVGLLYTPAPLLYSKAWMDAQIPPGIVLRRAWLTERSELQKRLAAFSRRVDVPLLDLTPAFRADYETGTELNFARDGHWNPAGHRVAARAIAAWMDREQLARGD